MSVKFVLINQ